MKKLNFAKDVAPHLVAIAVFFIVTFFFFKPIFLDNKVLAQHDIQMFQASAKSIQDFRKEYNSEPLWTNSMFGGMPAYLISVNWGNEPITFLKSVITIGLSHPIANIFAALVCYYVLLLAFGVRPYLAIGGAIAFGLSSYMIIGLAAGHNGRIGAIAYMPLVVAGIHLAFSGRRLLGFAVTATGLALHLKENHLQITYYLFMVVAIYGIVQFILALRSGQLAHFIKTIAILIPAAVIGAGTFFGQFWAITEYSKYSIRGKSELTSETTAPVDGADGLNKTYAFEFSNGLWEPLTLLIPNIYGGSSSNYLVMDQKSATFSALSRSGDQQTANQLARYSSSYWGPQRLAAPYYAGAIIVFLFALGIVFAPRQYVWWLASASVLGIALSWGSNFASFNYFLFDFLPGYNKFRSVTFTLIIVLFSMPLLGLIGLESLIATGLTKEAKRKLIYAFTATGGLCILLLIGAGMFSFSREGEEALPAWFANALSEDRESLLRSDAFRSAIFISIVFALVYFEIYRRLNSLIFFSILTILIIIDIVAVDKRYFTEDNYRRSRDIVFMPTVSDQEILNDTTVFRVFPIDLQNPFGILSNANPSYFHQSIGGYHGAKLRRYQDFVDSCLFKQTQEFFAMAQQGQYDFSGLSAFNMLNIKYLPYGPRKQNIITNLSANGNAWFVNEVIQVTSAAAELDQTCKINSKSTAVLDVSKFKLNNQPDSVTGKVVLSDFRLNFLQYKSESTTGGLCVFSEIYYPEGWIATIDGEAAEIKRVNYLLRALELPAGNHTVEFRFEPRAYSVGNKITMASSWLVVLVLAGSLAQTLMRRRD